MANLYVTSLFQFSDWVPSLTVKAQYGILSVFWGEFLIWHTGLCTQSSAPSPFIFDALFLLHSYFFLYFIIYLFAHLLIVLEIKFRALDMLGKHPTTVPYILLLITQVLMS